MVRPAYGGRRTCESCVSIDVRRWHREGRLHAEEHFSLSWTRNGKRAGNISVRTELDAAVLIYQSRFWGSTEWRLIEQRVPITWTACHLGGQRPWFVCSVYSNEHFCGRRAAVLYGAGELFACRTCCRLAYASQQETAMFRGMSQAQKIRQKMGGSANLFEPFPERPKGMHWRTYKRLRDRAETAEYQFGILATSQIERLKQPLDQRKKDSARLRSDTPRIQVLGRKRSR